MSGNCGKKSAVPYFRTAVDREFCHREFDSFCQEFCSTNLIDYEYERTLEKYLGRSFSDINGKIENADFDLTKAILTYHIRCERIL